ncbi:MAG: bifunctional nuclease family protein [Thermonemataceae bacterium]|nr:bifunctional nuclease family protein [Thermonemataceae bacterium]
MSKIRLEILGLSQSQAQSGSFALVLGERNGKRRLPIIIGMFEAQSIAIELEHIPTNRPMTHDLFRLLAESFEIQIAEVIISDLREGIFYAKLVCIGEDRKVEIDSRPSDAIAIALRFNAPVYTYEDVLSQAGIVLGEEDDDRNYQDSPSDTSPGIKEYSDEELKTALNEALEQEDYEKAAKIRDELSKRGL